jgi:uncharacterized glyoxalase superfamily protein PhnB
MPDAFEALDLPAEPIEPDPSFAARLRRRLEDALLTTTVPRGGAPMTTPEVHTDDEFTVTESGADDSTWGPTLTPYISVRGARQAIDWYIDVFAARLRGGMYEGPDGSIGHAELALGDAVLMLSDPWPEGGVEAPEPGRPHSHTLHLQVDDVDGTVGRAAERGAVVERQPVDEPYGRVATILDPYGHRWMLNQPPASATRVRHGDVAYITMSSPDEERTKAFFGAVLGWEFRAGPTPRGWEVLGRTPMIGLHGVDDAAGGATLCYRVGDIAAALDRVRAAGGEAREPDARDYGQLAECTDDQGVPFYLWQPPA